MITPRITNKTVICEQAPNHGSYFAYARLIARVTFNLVTAFYTDLIEDSHNLFRVNALFLFTSLIQDSFSFMHHDQAVAVLYGIAEVMSDHNGGHFLLFHDLVG